MRLFIVFNVFVRVFDHDDCGIDHCAHGNRNAPETHDVGVNVLKVHDDKGKAKAQRERNDCYKRRTHMPEKKRAHESDREKLLNEFPGEVVDCAVNERASVVGRDDFHAFRQRTFKRCELIFDSRNHFTRVAAASQ